MAARGWLGLWVALAGLINEGMEEGETLAHLGLTFDALYGGGWGRALLWPDLLVKGWAGQLKPLSEFSQRTGDPGDDFQIV